MGRGKQISKARHFPSYKVRCRVAPSAARVTLLVWAVGMWETKMTC